MELSDGEKLILVMLSDLYKKLKIDGEIDPDFVSEAITRGHLWGLKWQYPGVFGSSEPSEDTLRETVDILDMWSFLERGYKALSAAEKKRVEKDTAPLGTDVKFRGFDGNAQESVYIGIARFLIDKLDRFQEFKGRELNSHMPMLDAYRRMFPVFEPMRLSLGTKELDADQIISILKERIHPAKRAAN